MRVVAIVLLAIAGVVAVIALWAAIAFGREYGIDTFWLTLGWGLAFTLVIFVPGILLLRRSSEKRHSQTGRSRMIRGRMHRQQRIREREPK
jgi:membrane protein implicated in regulation of membrane protease activity